MNDPRRKSHKRFEQLNRIVDDIAPTLPTASHVAVLLVCFRHGRAGGVFRVSTRRIAKSVGLKERRVKTVLDDLERLGVIELVKEHQGPVPRQYKITGRVANGALHDTILLERAPQVNGALQGA